jgi:DNA polymerase I
MKHLIVDTSYLMYRSYFAYPKLTTRDGAPSGAIFGFIKVLLALIFEYQPDTLSFTMDLPQATWRHDAKPDYKAGRPEMQQDMVVQIPQILEWCKAVTTNIYSLKGYEADDHINTLVHLINQHSLYALEREEYPNADLFDVNETIQTISLDPERVSLNKGKMVDFIYIYSSDKDLYQLLVYPNVQFIRHTKDKQGLELYGQQEFRVQMELEPIQWIDYKTLVGDPGDNLKGLDGVGPKTATSFLQTVGSLNVALSILGLESDWCKEGVWANRGKDAVELAKKAALESKKSSKLLDQIRENVEHLMQTHSLSRLSFVPKDVSPTSGYSLEKGISIMERYNLKSLIGQLKHVKSESNEEQEMLF